MSDKHTKTLLTCEEFEKLAPSLGACELIDGEVVHLSPAGIPHSETSGRIYRILFDFVERSDLGRVLTNETGLHVRHDPPRSRGADVLYISYLRLAEDADPQGFLTVPPELIVEVISEPWAAMEEKIADYHAFGVDMVWVAEQKTRQAHIYPRGLEKRILNENETIDGGTVLPGFQCLVKRFFSKK